MHRPEYIREATPEMKDFLCDNADVITKLTIAAENPTVQYIPDFVKAGIIVSIGHSNATYEVAKAAFHKGATFATHLHNAMSPISSGRGDGRSWRSVRFRCLHGDYCRWRACELW